MNLKFKFGCCRKYGFKTVSYPLDIAFSFWHKVKQLAEKGKIISIDKVKNELFDKNDALEAWCIDNLPKDFFKDTSHVMAAYGQVIVWAMSRSGHYLPNALNEFLAVGEADAFLVAYALQFNQEELNCLLRIETLHDFLASEIERCYFC